MVRLSLLYRQPLHVVNSWPASELRLLSKYLSKCPAPEERIEFALAHLSAIYVNAHRNKAQEAKKIADFMLFADAWREDDAPDEQGYSAVDRSILRALIGE